MNNRSWFIPNPDYDGPPIELTCGRHTRSGRFIPKNVYLTGISRLSKYWRRLKMVGDPSTDEREIYEMHMAQKRSHEPNSCEAGDPPPDGLRSVTT
jgi:hypothetical protein